MLLGLCCGLGLYLDSMFVLTLAAIALAGLAAEISASLKDRKGLLDENPAGKRRFQFTRGLALILAFLAGASPRMISQRVEPYDAYHEQFSWSCNLPLLAEHGRILGLECLPRLIAGHRLPGLEADPDPALLGTGGPIQKTTMSREGLRAWTLLLVILALALLASALLALGATAMNGQTSAARIVAAGMLALVVEVAGGFLVNRNIFNADNYRYLVLLLIPWAIGCGLVLQQAIRTGGPAQVNALAVLVVLAVLFTCDVVAWYRRLGWVDERLVPVGRKVDDPAMRWLASHPEIGSIFGGYWDVYRISFLSGGKVQGVPLPIFPNRFPEWSQELPGGRPETLLTRRSSEGQMFLSQAVREGGKVLFREGGLTIVNWPWPTAAPERR